jgi:hypothetical protein
VFAQIRIESRIAHQQQHSCLARVFALCVCVCVCVRVCVRACVRACLFTVRCAVVLFVFSDNSKSSCLSGAKDMRLVSRSASSLCFFFWWQRTPCFTIGWYIYVCISSLSERGIFCLCLWARGLTAKLVAEEFIYFKVANLSSYPLPPLPPP